MTRPEWKLAAFAILLGCCSGAAGESSAQVLAGFTTLGGSRIDESFAIAVDADGFIYIAGRTESQDFPGAGVRLTADPQAFVAKLEPGGENLLWATYLGGHVGGEMPIAIAVDASGSAHVVGQTQSPDFPTTAGAFQPSCEGSGLLPESCVAAFVSKFSPDGTELVYSSFLFGAYNEDIGTAGWDEATGVAVDADGNIYVAGSTGSKHFPTTAGAFQEDFAGVRDGFVVKLDPAAAGPASLVYATYLGGSWNPLTLSYGTDQPTGIAIDGSGNAYVVGSTDSADFPTRNPLQPAYGGGQDGFVAKLSADGSELVYGTWLGGENTDTVTGVDVDARGQVHVTGQTKSNGFPVYLPLQVANELTSTMGDAFVSQLTADGRRFVYSTFLGGAAFDFGWDVAAGEDESTCIVGYTDSGDFPLVDPLPDFGPPNLAFVARIAPGGWELRFSSPVPGQFEAGAGIALDRWGNIHVAGTYFGPRDIDAVALTLACPGDCDMHAAVTVDEIIVAVNIALGLTDGGGCRAADRDRDGRITVDELLLGVTRALEGCP